MVAVDRLAVVDEFVAEDLRFHRIAGNLRARQCLPEVVGIGACGRSCLRILASSLSRVLSSSLYDPAHLWGGLWRS